MEIVNEEDPKKERKCTSSIRLSLGGEKRSFDVRGASDEQWND